MFTGLFLSAMLAHILHSEPGTTVAADVRIWLLGQLCESEETRFLIAVSRRNSRSPQTSFQNTVGVVELAGKRLFRRPKAVVSSGSHRACTQTDV